LKEKCGHEKERTCVLFPDQQLVVEADIYSFICHLILLKGKDKYQLSRKHELLHLFVMHKDKKWEHNYIYIFSKLVY